MIFREADDRDLVLAARKGDVRSFNGLVSRWEKRVYHYLSRLVGNRESAMDLCQDTFLKAYQGLRQLDDPERFPAWLFRIARNEAISAMRRRRPEGAWEDLPIRLQQGPSPDLSLPMALDRALARLSADQREAVLLKLVEGFKFQEIADVLQLPVSTVKSRVYTGIELLKETLAPARSGGSR